MSFRPADRPEMVPVRDKRADSWIFRIHSARISLSRPRVCSEVVKKAFNDNIEAMINAIIDVESFARWEVDQHEPIKLITAKFHCLLYSDTINF